MKRTQTVIIFIGLFIVVASVLSACTPSHPSTSVINPDECSQLVLSSDKVLLLPGDKSGIRTQKTELYLRNPDANLPRTGMNVTIELVSGNDVLYSQTQAAFSKPSGVEIAILPDLDPGLVASAPDTDSLDTNKIYYFANVMQEVLDQLSINDHGPTANFALVSIPDHAIQRFVSVNETYNFLMMSLPEMALMDRDNASSIIHDNLIEWMKTPGKFPRLILILRLRTARAELNLYEKLISESRSSAPPPIVVVDIGQDGDRQMAGNVAIVPLGLPPIKFDLPGWPPPAQWQHRLPGMQQALVGTLPAAISRISQVFELPELSWPVLLTDEQFQNTQLRVKLNSAQNGVLSCSRKLALSAPLPQQDTAPYLRWIGLIVVITSLLSLVTYFFPQLRTGWTWLRGGLRGS